VKFKVTEVERGISGVAYVTIRYEDGRTTTMGVDAGEDIAEKAKKRYGELLVEEGRWKNAMEYCKQFEGKEMSFS